MAREWKPGDVAITRPAGRALVIERRSDGALCWMFSDDSMLEIEQGDDARPLVVIDPEDREQVERLVSLYTSEAAGRQLGTTEALTWALREFANPTPPKPDEPTGLGAVVEEADGTRWTHNGFGWWCREAVNRHSVRHDYPWEKVAAVRVLSDGFVVAEPLADWERDLLRGDA